MACLRTLRDRARARRHPATSGLTLESTPRLTLFGVVTTAATTSRRLRVVDLADAVGVTPDTVRYYERVGLLAPPERTAAGYRIYDHSAVERLRFVQGCQRLGLRLRDIADLLEIRDTGSCPCQPAEELLRRRLAEVDAEMARLEALRCEMSSMIDALPAADCPPPLPAASWCPPGKGGEPGV